MSPRSIKPFEVQHGFRAGPLAGGSHTSPTDSTWGAVWVASDGLFAQLGVRAGDIPIEYHGGVADTDAALEQASSGQPSSFQVYNSGDAQLGHKALRRVTLPPVKKWRRASVVIALVQQAVAAGERRASADVD